MVLGVDCLGIKVCAELVLTYLVSAFDQQQKNKDRIGMMHGYQEEN